MTGRAKFRFHMEHELEEAVREGRKTIDVRVSIEPFADVKKGDVIAYHHTHARVLHIRTYPGMGDLMAHEDFTKIVPGAKDLNDALHTLMKHMDEKNPAHGVMAIEIEPLEAE